MPEATATTAVTLQLTAEQAVLVPAALIKAADVARTHQGTALDLHESSKVGPVLRAEAWQTYLKWLGHENDASKVCDAIRAQAGDLPFSAYQRFS